MKPDGPAPPEYPPRGEPPEDLREELRRLRAIVHRAESLGIDAERVLVALGQPPHLAQTLQGTQPGEGPGGA